MSTATILLLLLGVPLGLLWELSHKRRAHRRALQAECEHPNAARGTARVNNIMTMNPVMLHAIIPGRRWLIKYCRVCGAQWPMYRNPGVGHLQDYDEFVAEWNRETVDRDAQLAARTAAHEREKEWVASHGKK